MAKVKIDVFFFIYQLQMLTPKGQILHQVFVYKTEYLQLFILLQNFAYK